MRNAIGGRGTLIRHGAMVFAASLAINGCNYAFHAFNSRLLGIVGYGELASLIALFTLLSVPSAALSLGVVKYAAELHASGDRAGLRRLVDVLLRGSAAVAALLLVLALVTLPLSTRFLQIRDPLALMLTAAAVAVGLAVPIVRGVLQGIDEFRSFAIATAIEGIAKLAIGVALPLAGFGVRGALLGFFCGSLASLVFALFALRPHLSSQESRLVVDMRRLRETIAGIGSTSLAFALLGVADLVAVKHFFDPHDAGLYGALSLIGKIFLFAVGFVPQVVLPKVARRNAAGLRSTHLLIVSVALVALVGIVGVGLCAVAPSLAVRIVAGGQFAGIANLLVPYAAAMTFLAIANVGASYRIGIHQLGFALPLVVVTIGEAVGYALWHGSLHDIVRIVLIGHACAAAATLVRLPVAGARSASVPIEAAA